MLSTGGAPLETGICLPGTELLQSPFRTEFSMGSRLLRYWRSLRCHCRFLQSYRQSLRRCRNPWCDRRSAMPIVARLTKHHKTLLNIVKHHETHVKHCDSSWNTLKTLWNIMKHSSFDATISALGAETSALNVQMSAFGAATLAILPSYRWYWCGVSGDCGVGITSRMCNRVTNHGDMSFSKPVPGIMVEPSKMLLGSVILVFTWISKYIPWISMK